MDSMNEPVGGVVAIYLVVKEFFAYFGKRNGNGNGHHHAAHDKQIRLAERSADALEAIVASNDKIATGMQKIGTDLTLALERQGEMRKQIDRIERNIE